MSGNIAHLSDFKEFDGGYVTFGGGANGGRITGKGTIKTDKLDFEDVYFVKELKFNLFSVSQMCDKKNYVLFTDSECLVLSPNFKLPDESQATSEESMLWHRRLGHVNFKNINKLVKDNLVRDLPLKRFENDQTCVACLKGKQHRASCIQEGESSISSQQDQDCIFMPIWKDASYFEDGSLQSVDDAQLQDQDETHDDCSFQDDGIDDHQVNTASPQVNTGSRELSTAAPEVNTATSEGLMGPIPTTEDTQEEDQGIDLGNLSPSYAVSSTPHTRIHKDHPIDHVIGDVQSSVQTRRMTTSYSELGFLSAIYEGKTHQDLHTCLFACFLSQEEPKRVSKALSDPAWVEAMQEELLQFKLQNIVEGGIVVRNKARLVAQGHTQEEGIDYDEVFAPVARIEAINLVLAYLLFMGFTMSSMGELTFFLGLQVQQKKKGIFISQDKYVHEILKKFNYTDVKSASTPTDLERPLVKDADADDVATSYKDIHDWIFDDSPLELVAYTDSDYAGATLDRKSTTGVVNFWEIDFCDKHNMIAFLEKSLVEHVSSRLIDFITRSHIFYALTKKPAVCISFIRQFWRSAEILTDDNGTVKIHATIDGHSFSITEGSLQRHLKLDDQDGVSSAQLARMGYATDSDKLTFQKGAFSPQWRFLIHNILHCLSPKKTAWEQFSSNIAAAVICLATNRKFNFSRMIFDHMVSNISSPHKFLMYPRFIQLCLDMQRHKFQQHTRFYSVPSLTMKVFSNMKRSTKGFSGQEVPLFPTMIDVTEPSPLPSRITSSPSPTPSPSPQPSPTQPSPSQPSPTQPSPTQPESANQPPTPHDSPLHVVHSHGSEEGSLKLQELMNVINTLSDRVGALEADLTKTKKTYSSAYTKLILRVKKLEAQGRNFSTEGVQDDEGVHEKASNDTELFVQEVTPTELIQDQEASGKASDEVSTAGKKRGPISEEVPTVSTAEGKAILIEEEPKKKSKKDIEQEQLSFAEAIRLEEQMHEEQRAQIARKRLRAC
ncbi:putative ribonuclease H-like domain-containing protein [Tanacetum coccineum]